MNIELLAAWFNFIALATGYITMCAGGLFVAGLLSLLATRFMFARVKSLGKLTSYFLWLSGEKEHARDMKDA